MRIATGQRVRSPADDALTWMVATQARADVRLINVAKDSLGRGEATLKGLDARLDWAHKSLENVRDLLVAARSPGADRGAIAVEVRSTLKGLWSMALGEADRQGTSSPDAAKESAGSRGDPPPATTAPEDRSPSGSDEAAGSRKGPPDHASGRGPENGSPQGRPFHDDDHRGRGRADDRGRTAAASGPSASEGSEPRRSERPGSAREEASGPAAADTGNGPREPANRLPDTFLGVPVAGGDIEIVASAHRTGGTTQVTTMSLGADGEAFFRAVGAAYEKVMSADLQAMAKSEDGLKALEQLVALTDRAVAETASVQTRVGVMLSRMESQSEFLGALADVTERAAASLTEADLESEAARLKSLEAQRALAATALAMVQGRAANALRILA